MDYDKVKISGSDILLTGVKNFSIAEIFESGQCFRWQQISGDTYEGVAFARKLRISQNADEIIFFNTTPNDFETVWRSYFDLDRDYGKLKELLCTDLVMGQAVSFCPGMRVLRQEPWEALCSFILSQNNNIKRIKGLVQRLCECFGEDIGEAYAFPHPDRLSGLDAEDLAPVRSGFRAKYILDAADKVHSGELKLEEIHTLPIAEARAALCRIFGVGPKVADCALLYGFAKAECMPVDVWIRRALENLYPEGFPERFIPVAGLAQQYLFHYMRCCEEK